MRAHDIDIVHARSNWAAWLALIVSEIVPVRYVATWHGSVATGGMKKIFDAALTRAEVVIANSQFTADALAAHHDIKRVETIARGCDIDALDPARRTPCLLYTSPSPRDATLSRMPSSA